MDAFIHQLLAGLATGGIYATVALALVMIYQATHHINFAQGEMAMFSTFIAWALLQAGLPYWWAFLATVALSFVLGGFIVGVLENLVGSYVVGTELKLSVALVLIVGVLIVRPAGLMGRKVVRRV